MPLDIGYYLCIARAVRMRAFASGNAFVREEQDIFEARAFQAEAARLDADRAVVVAEEALEAAIDDDEAAEWEADRSAVKRGEAALAAAKEAAAAAKLAEDFAEAEARQAAEAAIAAWQGTE